jgi:hypothetical protein
MRDGEAVHLEKPFADSLQGKVLGNERRALVAASIV